MTPEQLIESLVDDWHDAGDGSWKPLPEYLRMTNSQYARWVMGKLSEEELAEWAKKWNNDD